jgi:hypothetical protein
MNQQFEAADYSDLRREVEVLRKRLEDLESRQVRAKAASRVPRWPRSTAGLAVPAVIVVVLLALGMLLADGNPDALFIDANGDAKLRGNALIGGDLNLGNSVLYFTKTDRNGTAQVLPAGVAAIENSKSNTALRIFGRETPMRRRVVSISDRLGIGTDYPDATLQVGGDAMIVGTLTVDKIQGILTTALDPAAAKESRLLTIEGTTIVKRGEIRGALWTSPDYEWIQGQSPRTMTKADHSVCFLTSVRGFFAGTGESVDIK